MMEALFQHIPRGLFEMWAVLGLLGCVLFLIKHWRKDRAETVLCGFAVFFMVFWRVIRPINADRYVLALIPPAIFFSLYAVAILVHFIRRHFPFPGIRVTLCVLLLVCMMKSFRCDWDDRQMFREIAFLKAETVAAPKPVRVVSNYDLSCFLGDDYDVTVVWLKSPVRLEDLPDASYYLLRLTRKKMPGKLGDFHVVRNMRCPGGKTLYLLLKKEKMP